MAKKKNIEELEDIEIPELEEGAEENETKEEVEGTKHQKSFKEQWEKYLDSLNMKLDSFGKAIATNQKYIQKLWDRLKLTEDNFRIHIEKE